jgi:uncharacterized protein (TIGR02246 family)
MLPNLLFLFLLAAGPEADIRALLDRQQADWNRGDLDAFMTGYEDADTTTFMGKTITRGYRSVLENYKKRYPDAEARGVLRFSEIEIRMLNPDAALVLGKFELERKQPASGRFTLVFKRTGRGWKIIHDHTS